MHFLSYHKCSKVSSVYLALFSIFLIFLRIRCIGNQIIISISREYGSEGHTIAKQIAKDLGLPFYDRNMLDEIAKEKGFDPAVFAGVD